MLSLDNYAQNNPQVNLKVIDKDTVFCINKDYAVYTLSKFDSLTHFRNSFFDCANILEDCVKVKDQYKKLSDLKEEEIRNLNRQILYCDEISESYYKSDMLNKELNATLKKQLRKTKVWNGIGWGAITTTVITSLFLILK